MTFQNMRVMFLLVPLLAGCAHQRPAQFNPASFDSPGIERSLQYWTANNSHSPSNHYYVYATDMDRGELVSALVYWREGGRILVYSEEPQGSEPKAWRLRPKVDRNTVSSDESVTGANEVVPHGMWVRWMKDCIDHGKEYAVNLSAAQEAFPAPKESP